MKAQIKFLGAAGVVTGSRTLLRFDSKSYLIDCGLFQGPPEIRKRNWERFPVDPKSIDAVILTHAHIDHTGYLPKLYKEGFKGPVYASKGTSDLCNIMLLDSAKLQVEDARYANETKHSHFSPALPLYGVEEAEAVLKNFKPQNRDEWIQLDKNLSIRFLRSGHIIGSSFLQISMRDEHNSTLLTFSGDVGHDRSLTLKGPVDILESDILVLESTYGNRLHSRKDLLDELAVSLNTVLSRKGVCVIPVFAVGRAQELLYAIRRLELEARIPKVPVILDSPMASSATDIFLNHQEDARIDSAFLGDEKALFPEHFEATSSADESMLACMKSGPLVVLSASGMLSGGRVLHHLKHRLGDPNNMVLFVGYQAEGSKGRFLLEQGKSSDNFRIHHEKIPVEAEIVVLDVFSGHADYEDLLAWLKRFKKGPRQIYLNHGSPESTQALKFKVEALGFKNVDVAVQETSYDI